MARTQTDEKLFGELRREVTFAALDLNRCAVPKSVVAV
jgi:hypothetical protein